MKKFICFLGVTLICVSFAMAGQPKFRIPISVNGVADINRSYSGVESVTLVTSTTPVLVADSDSVTIGNGFIHWIIIGSTAAAAAQGYLELRSTDTANVSSARLIPRVLMNENSADTAGSQLLRFSPPIPFPDGLSVNLGPVGAIPTTVEMEFAVGVSWKKE